MTSSYRKGADFERRVKARLEEQGYTVFRSAGSHTLVDLIAFKEDGKVLFVQCKGGKRGMTKAQIEEFRVFAERFGCTAMLALRGMKFEQA